jgi:hypothetical protein
VLKIERNEVSLLACSKIFELPGPKGPGFLGDLMNHRELIFQPAKPDERAQLRQNLRFLSLTIH